MAFRLDPSIEGNESGDTLVFVQGWPDDASLWDPQVAALSERYRCVRITLPNFDGARTTRWGHSTEEILDALAGCIREVSPDDPVTLIVHDWGSHWGHTMHNRHPELAHRAITLDVAPHVKPKLWSVPAIIAYQLWLTVAFLIGGSVGDGMTRRMAGLMGAPAPPERLTAWMNYPYRNMFTDILTGRARTFGNGYWPEMPLLFVYGKRKPFPFHSAAWLDHLERTGGRVVGLDCGHWVMRDPGFDELLSTWLEATDR